MTKSGYGLEVLLIRFADGSDRVVREIIRKLVIRQINIECLLCVIHCSSC